ncbi:4-hydroxy-3-methylbut-2-en-1-yl diphosphate synthase [Helicobacter monodelphidis]|nr:4-hydroxy-3-methylbut-2-en-1-yl diphosphate synthase [Helicobacter sp. 15-1451]
MQRYKTKKIYVGNVAVGGDSPISIQSMTYSKTANIPTTIEQIEALMLAGCDIVRVAISDEEDALALRALRPAVNIPLVADIHFRHKLAILATPYVDCIRINPGNIGSKEKIKEVTHICQEYKIPIRIGVNSGSLESQFEQKYGQSSRGMVESALYHISLLEDLGFTEIKVSLKASDVERTLEAYRLLRPLTPYPFHLGVTEAGTLFDSTIKSAMALGGLLLEGIGDTIRVSITGELEKEVEVARAILKFSGRTKEGIYYISCPTCGRIEVDLVEALEKVKSRLTHIKAPLVLSIMGCAVNALGEAKSADLAIAFGHGDGLIIKKGEIVCKLKGDDLIERFILEVEQANQDYFKNKELGQ